ncbi:MAG TPA: glycogen debranching enzyme GlgX, partial [Rhodocyclaceae bacterium]|nr:glycogen debranching enzyme GlgX [Rhodocyclaceae bacterium]
SEWNDRFRDDVRAFWLTRSAGVAALAHRLAGSSEVFRAEGRLPQAGINFVTAHDGFTLRDLVSYNERNNAANGEHNRDGHAVNHAWNCGVEGPSEDPAVLDCRRRLSRALLATLFVAQGVPMLQGGDEIARTQRGNNNAYCQDNALTWFDWAGAGEDAGLADFVGGLAALRRRLPLLRQRRWLTGEAGDGGSRPDCLWWHPDGHPMTLADWHDPALASVGMWLSAPGQHDLLCVVNRAADPVGLNLPDGLWRQLLQSAAGEPFAEASCLGLCVVAGRSVSLLEKLE